ncbi:unnamed protein product [Rotaria magnacalcarata]|uniref:Uncharacterized protein n=2 Tax=Rotaria magnacalcarata TaxID=392030 RepID=A0A820IYQ6_9BILA|nr:unnamed protein product [Rotaria magnacalcarata]CAF4316273.1 unnamed protein product [Rotaria magnacalcarata]
MRVRHLVFCFQDPVHLCIKIRNRLLYQSASMMIGNREISAAYHSIEINAHTLLSVVLLVCQHDLPESALSISSYNSQTCENIFRLTKSMSGTFSSNVNFTVAQFLRWAGKLSVLQEIERQNKQDDSKCFLQFPKHHKRRLRKTEHLNDHLQTNNILTQNNIEKTIYRAYNGAYNMLAVLGIDKI